MNVIFYIVVTACLGHPRSHLRGGKNKNTDIFICQYVTVKNRILMFKIPVRW